MRVPDVSARAFRHMFLLVVVFAAAACGKTTTTTSVVGPSGNRCDISVTNSTPEVPASGGNGNLTVNSARDCDWSATAEASWITLSATSGQGPATVNYSVLPNPNGTSRRGRVVVSQVAVDIAQAAAPCRYQVSSSAVNVDASQGQISIRLTAPDGCRWNSRSDVSWIGNIVPAEGVGSATIRFTIAPNTTDARTGTVVIGDATVRIHQSGSAEPPSPPIHTPSPAPTPSPGPTPAPGPTPTPNCTYGVSPVRVTVSSAAEQIPIEVTTQLGCTWVASSSAPWIDIISVAAGSGNGSFRAAVSGNSGGARTGTVTVEDRTVTIEQAAPAAPSCSYRLGQTTRNIGRDRDEFTVGVNAPQDCTWRVSTDFSWINVVDGRNGSGNGSFSLVVDQNVGGPRTGTVRVVTETFTVHQAGGECTYSIKPTYYHAGRGPDDIKVDVTAQSGCTWTTTNTPNWVTVDQGRSGSGNGRVRLLIPANNDPPRSASITIAGQPFALRQNGSCTTSIKPTYYHAGRGPDDIRIAVTADPGCSWTAESTVSWVRVVEGRTGSDNGTVRLLVDANSGSARSVTLTIAGQPFDLRQNGSK
jgi:hypothetical protein